MRPGSQNQRLLTVLSDGRWHLSRELHDDHDAERALSRIAQTGNGCWLWTGRLNYDGYGQIDVKGRSLQAHRFVYECLVGAIPEGLTIDHLCRKRSCVNPAHLEPVTNRVNILRGDTLAARHAAKTHCHRGHPLAGENIYVHTLPWRKCRVCHKITMLGYRARVARSEGRTDAAARLESQRYRLLSERGAGSAVLDRATRGGQTPPDLPRSESSPTQLAPVRLSAPGSARTESDVSRSTGPFQAVPRAPITEPTQLALEVAS